MTQNDLNRAVAAATGETVRTIAELGFGLADPDRVDFDLEPYDPGARLIDSDQYDLERNVASVAQRSRHPGMV